MGQAHVALEWLVLGNDALPPGDRVSHATLDERECAFQLHSRNSDALKRKGQLRFQNAPLAFPDVPHGIEQLAVILDDDAIEDVVDPLLAPRQQQCAIVPEALLEGRREGPGSGWPKRGRSGIDIIAVELGRCDEIAKVELGDLPLDRGLDPA